jgi:GntR family transcriptional regulator
VTSWGPDVLKIDKTSSVPIYAQLVDRIEAMVSAGVLASGDMLPSIRSVAEYLRIDYNTVARAYTELDRAGVIHTARGVGTRVTGHVDAHALERARQAKLTSTVEACVQELAALGYAWEEINKAIETALSGLQGKERS